MSRANTAHSSAGTKSTAAAARRKVAGSLMAPTCVVGQVLCQRLLARSPPAHAAPEPAPGDDCLTAYASRRPTAYTAAAFAAATRPAPCAPCAPCSIRSAERRGARPKIAGVPSPARGSPPGTLRECASRRERRTHGSEHHAETRVRAAGGRADRRHLPASPPPAEPPVGREALRRLRGHRLGRRRVSHRPRGPALGARLGRCPRPDAVVSRAAAGGARPPRAPSGRHQDEGRDAVLERPAAWPPRARLEAAQRRARVPLRLPRGHRGGAALAHVPGVREPDGLRRGGARLLGPARGAAGDRDRAALPRALL